MQDKSASMTHSGDLLQCCSTGRTFRTPSLAILVPKHQPDNRNILKYSCDPVIRAPLSQFLTFAKSMFLYRICTQF
jgi:hypothetical protein